jgi:integrase
VTFGTGARTSELIALQWPHVDFQRKHVQIRQGFVNGRLTTLRTEGASRDIDMLPSVEEAPRQQMEETKGQGRYAFSNAASPARRFLVIASAMGIPLTICSD